MFLEKSKPEKGTEMWDVREHLYYVQEHAGPLKEYIVCKVFVKGYFKGNYVSIDVTDGATPRRYRLSEIGSRLFYTAREAAEYARRLSDQEDGIGVRLGEPPVRRLWEKLLLEGS